MLRKRAKMSPSVISSQWLKRPTDYPFNLVWAASVISEAPSFTD